MKVKLKNNKPNTSNNLSENKKFEFISLFFFIGFLLIDFMPQFRSTDIIGPQYLYLSLLNIAIGLVGYFNPKIFNKDLVLIFKNTNAIKAYLVFILFCGVSVLFARNQSLAVVSFIRLIIIFVTFVNLSILLNNRLHLIYKIIFLIGISVFTQCFQELYSFTKSMKTDSILYGLESLKGNTGNINIFAASVNIKIPFLLIGIFHFTKWKKWFLISALLLAILLIFLSGSRAAFLSLSIEFVIFSIFYLKINSLSQKKVLSLSYIFIPLIISFLVANLILEKEKSIRRYKSVGSRATQITDLKEGSANRRLQYWNIALKMMNEKPFVGIGLGNWKVESTPYEKATHRESEVSSYTHNDFLELGAETGILNGIIYMSLFIFCLYSNLSTILKSENLQNRTISLLALLLICSYGVDALLNFPLYRPTMQLGFCLFLSLTIINTASKNKPHLSFLNILVFMFIIVTSIATLYFSFHTFIAYRLESDRMVDSSTSKTGLTTSEIINKLPQYPNVLTFGEPWATYVGRCFIEEGNFEQANKYLNIGNTINPYLGRTEFYKFIIAEKTGKKDSAFIYAKKALEIRPRTANFYVSAINSAIVLNDTEGILDVHNLYVQYENHPRIWLNTSKCLSQSNYGIKKTIEFIEKGLLNFPNDSSLLERKKLLQHEYIRKKNKSFIVQAGTFYNDQKYVKAIEAYNKALNIDPKSYILLQNIGLCYYKLKQYIDAISYFKTSLISPNANNGKSQYFLGMSYFFIKDKENGCKYLNFARDKNYGNAQEILRQTCD
jgi:O-antigen ligase